MKERKKAAPKKLPPYLINLRNEIIVLMADKGYGTQDITDVLNSGISRSRVNQVIRTNH